MMMMMLMILRLMVNMMVIMIMIVMIMMLMTRNIMRKIMIITFMINMIMMIMMLMMRMMMMMMMMMSHLMTMLLTFDVVFGDAFASRSRLTICEWPCWAACKILTSNCIHSMKVDLNWSAFRLSPLASILNQSGRPACMISYISNIQILNWQYNIWRAIT